MNLNPIQTSLARGELAPSMLQKHDLALIQSGLKTCFNFFIKPQGGAANRPGTRMYHETKYADKKAVFIPFKFNNEQVFTLEVGDKYIRFFTPEGLVLKEGEIYEIISPYAEKDLDNIYYHQSADTIYLACKGVKPYELQRHGNLDWRFEVYQNKKGPYLNQNLDSSMQMLLSYGNGRYKLSCNNDYFKDGHIGALFRIKNTFDSKIIKKTFTAAGGTSEKIICTDTWSVKTSGNWTGTLYIEKSKDLITWYRIATFTNDSDGNNVNSFGDTNESGLVWVRMGYTQATSGNCVATLSNPGFTYELHSKVVDVIDTKTAYVELDEDLAEVFTLLGSVTTTYTNIMPKMTSNTAPKGIVSGFGGGRSGQSGTADTALLYYGADGNMDTSWFPPNTSNPTNDPTRNYWQYEFANPSIINEVEIFILSPQLYGRTELFVLQEGKWISYGTGKWKSLNSSVVWSFASTKVTAVKIFHWTVSAYIPGFKEIKINGIEESVGSLGTVDWAEGVWSDVQGYPRAVTMYQSRVCWAKGRTVDATETEDYNSFARSTPLVDSDGISISIKSLNEINALVGLKSLVALTGEGPYVHSGGTFTPSSTLDMQNGYGGKQVKPAIIGDRVIYVQQAGTVLRDIVYNFESDSYGGDDLRLFSAHLFEGKEIVSIAYQQEPDSLLWVLFNDGTMAVMTYFREQSVLAWARFWTDGIVESITSNTAQGYDDLWLMVKRGDKRFVERLEPRMKSKKTEDQFFVDCGVVREYAEAQNVITGLEHLEGREVSVLADGYVMRDNPLSGETKGKYLVVKNGQITLPNEYKAKKVIVGLPYACEIETLPLGGSYSEGSLSTVKKNISEVWVWVINSIGGLIGTRVPQVPGAAYDENANRLFPFDERPQLNKPKELFSGFKKQNVTSVSDPEVCVAIRQEDPLPFEISAIIPELEVSK